MRGRSSIRRFIRSLRPIDLVPGLALAVYGAIWIALHASPTRGSIHTLFQALTLTESVVALLLVRRKPLGSLVGILIVYLLFALEQLSLPPTLFALAALTAIGSRRAVLLGIAATTTVVVLMPYVHGGGLSITSAAWALAAVGISVLIGLLPRIRSAFQFKELGGDA